jgi:hypothetical protein
MDTRKIESILRLDDLSFEKKYFLSFSRHGDEIPEKTIYG